MEWLVISWFLSFGWVPIQADNVGQSSAMRENATFAEIGVSGEMADRVTIFGSVETYQTYLPSKYSFAPYLANYRIGATFRIIDGVSITADHLCIHPVLSIGEDSYMKSGGKTRVYLKIEGKANL